MEKIILLHTFLKISFGQYKEYLIFQISFSKFSNVLHAFTCASTGNLLVFVYELGFSDAKLSLKDVSCLQFVVLKILHF